MTLLQKLTGYLLLPLALVGALAFAGCGGGEGDLDPPSLTLQGGVFRTPIQTTSITLEGAVEPGATVEVFLNDNEIDSGQILVIGGDWSATVNNLVVGANVIEVRATDDIGNNNSLALVVVREVVTIEQFVSPTPDGAQTVSGRVAADNTVAVSISDAAGTVVSEGAAQISGVAWSYDITGLPQDGDYVLVATATDGAGVANTASVTLNVLADAPLLTLDPFVPEVSSASHDFSGAYSGQSISLFLNGVEVDEFTQDGANWSFSATALPIGENTLLVTVTGADLTTASGTTSVLFKP
ncbi:hypothetical protein DESUT3_22850 [Desulfuromonas versatilis]|uniref:Bacterial Ig-like domain-containing protein n=1 Tax=Desulfuromonas versatilis TaxID=2802975 RepID=A0ABM8HTH2_9BACT|nr:hypothetical protein [Desulfuromonas versatilis]BCR05216.1 hypothetical protein DESUT3_22850 [Desulfuromonas versatilis]